ncbi:hypothetical protein [Nocardia vulneris]|uniref:hypothetical protein n=1 Tax=Nocardia vulneris TaxID=1141657 RepID=UPI0012DFFD5A|nr:hypothetical protein [Nocardia vulneris]
MDDSITIDHLRECREPIPLDGARGILRMLPAEAREQIDRAVSLDGDGVGAFDRSAWYALDSTLRRTRPDLAPILEWLSALAEPPVLRSDDAADRAWQEQRDAVGTIARIFDVPPASFSAWRRPTSPHAPYLAGLIPEPVEHSLIDHDSRVSVTDRGIFDEWGGDPSFRCDIHVVEDTAGRRLEVANVNATDVEKRLGTDMIYYHEATASFMLVQYKRLDAATRTMSVDSRLMDQLERLEAVSRLSKQPARPEDWRLGIDPCFLKLAYWPSNQNNRGDSLSPGMYLPVSYIRLLLRHDCTLSGRKRSDGSPGRMLGYPQVPRHLVSTQFIELVQHGLAGTIGVTVEQLRAFVFERVRAGHDAVIGTERSQETPNQRQKRIRERSSKKRSVKHIALNTAGADDDPALFSLPSAETNTPTRSTSPKRRQPR